MPQDGGITVGQQPEFVHFSPDQPRLNAEIRRKVRSNAIKFHWRRRQQQEQQRQQQQEEGQKQSKSSSKAETKDGSEDGAVTQDLNKLLDDEAACDDDGTTVDAHNALANKSVAARANTRTHSLLLNAPGQRTAAMSIRPSLWGQTDPSGLESPRQIELMVAISRHWYSWLGSDSPAIANHVRDAFTQVANTKPLLLASTCLAGIASRTAVDPGQTSGLELAVKGSALRRLQMRLEDWDQTAADEVVRSILMLVTFEMIRINDKAEAHLQGLLKVMKLASRRMKFNRGINRVFESAYLLTPMLLGSVPIRTQLPSWYARSFEPPIEYPHGTDDEPELILSPLESFARMMIVLNREQQLVEERASEPDEALAQIKSTLQNLAEVLSLLSFSWASRPEGNRAIKHQVVSVLKPLQSLEEQHRQLPNPTNELSKLEPDSHKLVQAANITLNLLCNVVFDGHDFDDPNHQQMGETLLVIFRRGLSYSWRELPFLVCLMFMTGASVCVDRASKGYLFNQIPRLNMSSTLNMTASWEQTRAVIVEFARLRAGVDRRRDERLRMNAG